MSGAQILAFAPRGRFISCSALYFHFNITSLLVNLSLPAVI